MIGDFNGDGKTDFAFVTGQNRTSTNVFALMSNGDGTFNVVNTIMSGDLGTPPSAHWAPVTGDFNGDGKSDFAFVINSSIWMFISNGDGTFTSQGQTFGANLGSPPQTNWTSLTGDFNGDGKTDIAFVNGASDNAHTNIFALVSTGALPDLVSGIATGLGATFTITYQPLTNSAVYSKDTSSTYPVQDTQGPLYVVSRVDTPDGVGGSYAVSYSYAGAKADLSGRGFPGFRQMAVTDLQTNIVQTTTYRQDFPYVGLVGSTTKSLGALALNRVTNSYQFSNASGAAAVTTTGAPYRVSLGQNVTSSNDLDGTPVPALTTTSQYDAYGNPTSVVTSTSDGYSKTTTNTYSNDRTSWYLGRLTRATVTSQAP